MVAMSGPSERLEPDGGIDEAAQDWFLRLCGNAGPAERAAFEAWRSADPRHETAYREVCEAWQLAEALEPAFAARASVRPAQPRPAAVPGRGRRAATGNSRIGGRHRRAALGALAAALATVIVAAAVDLPMLLRADYSTAVGELASVTLPDGSIAYLNTDSAVAIDFSGPRRQVSLLRGEALFEVAAMPDRPFDVLALGGRSTALGTAFAVRERGETATVTVTEGRVRVAAPSAATTTPPTPEPGVMLDGGEQVSYRSGSHPGPVAPVDGRAATAWRDGAIVIDDLPLAEALAEIDRYRRGKILLLADAADAATVTGRLSLRSLDSGIAALAATHGLTVTPLTDLLLIVR